jgi:nitrous oxidase accessory protein NosD
LGVVSARLLSTNQLGENLTVNLYPNPTGAGNEVVLSIEGNSKSRRVTVYNAVGSKVSSHRIEKGQQQIKFTAASPGIYFIEVDGAGNQIKWVVE